MASKQLPDSGISNQKVEANFGDYPTDFIEYHVYDSDDNFIISKIKKSGAKSDLVELNPGKVTISKSTPTFITKASFNVTESVRILYGVI